MMPPVAGAKMRHDSANTLIIALAAAMDTSNERANSGMIGAMSPKPKAIMKAATTRIQISFGMSPELFFTFALLTSPKDI